MFSHITGLGIHVKRFIGRVLQLRNLLAKQPTLAACAVVIELITISGREHPTAINARQWKLCTEV